MAVRNPVAPARLSLDEAAFRAWALRGLVRDTIAYPSLELAVHLLDELHRLLPAMPTVVARRVRADLPALHGALAVARGLAQGDVA